MADTQRTIATLLGLLADNSSGDISAQDVRDVLVTIVPSHADMYISSSAQTSIANVNEWTIVAGTTNMTAVGGNFTMSGNNIMRLDSVVPRFVVCMCSVSMTAAGNGKTFEWAFAKNGAIESASIVQRKIGTGGDVGAVGMNHGFSMTQNDTISVYVRNVSDDTNVTATKMNLTLMGHPL